MLVKTTAILHLLTHKPSDERWAVLVNEFGEIGVDSSLLRERSSNERGMFIREVPGGCMCCASGLPMQVALNQLLTKSSRIGCLSNLRVLGIHKRYA